MQKLLNQNESAEPLAEFKKGIYQTLGVTFASTAHEIEKQYSHLRKYLDSQGDSVAPKLIDSQKKVQIAYETIISSKERQKYFSDLRIRSLLNQQLESYSLLKRELKLFPFFAFQVYRKQSNDVNGISHLFFPNQRRINSNDDPPQKQNIVMEFDFINQTITERKDGKDNRAFLFCNICIILYDDEEGSFLMHIWESGKIVAHRFVAKYAVQRDLIVQVALMAKQHYEETKPDMQLQSPNPNFEDADPRASLSSPSEHRKNRVRRVYLRDRVAPPKRDRRFKAKRKKFLWRETVYIEVGSTQCIVARDEDFKQICHVIPLKKDLVSFTPKAGNREVLDFYLEKESDADIFLHSVRRAKETNPLMIRHFYEINSLDLLVRSGLMSLGKEDIQARYSEKVAQCKSTIKKMSSRIDILKQEDSIDAQDLKLWERNQAATYSKLGNLKKQKQRTTVGLGYSIPSNFNYPYTSISSNYYPC